jgi:hypothetical protein
MNYEEFIYMIDKKIIQSFSDGLVVSVIQEELVSKKENFIKVVQSHKDDFTLEKILTTDWETVAPVRAKYSVFYVQHADKRIKDLDWLILNKYKFKKYSNSQVFNLIKLKEKLSIDNSCPF